MMFFRKKQSQPAAGPKAIVSLTEYQDQESGKKHWDVFVSRSGYRNSVTDDYGFETYEAAVAAYTRQLAIERGEIKVGLAKYTIDETVIP